MLEGQTSIFEMLYPTYKIKKPIRLIEFFAGYGSQALALKYLGVPFVHWQICEWAIKSIQAYKDIHFTDKDIELNPNRTKEEMINFLYQKGISNNYNDPMTKEQIARLSEDTLKTIIKNIAITHNLVNIQQVKGEDLKIVDTDNYCYILTYSFPCQDLSLAGKGKGMSDTSTRSGMLWEVERILTECKEIGELPEILLMENVPQVHGADNVEHFNKWQLRLEELGYKNYWQDLIATDYGIPQTRNRCFMVSILGDYNYTFPKTIPLKLKLKDMLENNVSEKYYLSDKMINYILNRTPLGEKDNFANNIIGNDATKNAGTITTKGSNTGTSCRSSDNFIVDNMDQKEVDENIYLKTETCLLKNKGTEISKLTDNANTLMARDYKGFGNQEMNGVIQIRNATKKGYLEATEGDGIDISGRMQYHRGTVQKGKTQSLTTSGGGNNGVIVKKIGNYTPSKHNASSIVDKDYSAPTVMENHGTVTATQTSDLRIRKLTPRECFRLMGVKDNDFDKVAKNQSDSSLYHLAGDSIVVNVLMAIFKELL